MKAERIAIVGRGRMGAGLGAAWQLAGHSTRLLAREGRDAEPGLPVVRGDAAWGAAVAEASVIIVATPDDAIRTVAARLAELGTVAPSHVVLHLSGLLDHRVLEPLAASGAALGSMHPLMAISNAAEAASRLAGAYAAVEGDSAAVAMASALARDLRMEPVEIAAEAKPAYHAAAAITSNFTVTVYDAAVQVAVHGGVPEALARRLYLPLLRGTVENLAQAGPVAALTGAIRRGDTSTVAAHLAAVGAGDARRLYLELGWATLALARRAGLDEAVARRIEGVLRGA